MINDAFGPKLKKDACVKYCYETQKNKYDSWVGSSYKLRFSDGIKVPCPSKTRIFIYAWKPHISHLVLMQDSLTYFCYNLQTSIMDYITVKLSRGTHFFSSRISSLNVKYDQKDYDERNKIMIILCNYYAVMMDWTTSPSK